MAVEEAAQEIGRQEAAFGADGVEFVAETRYLGQCFRSARSGRIGTSDTQTIDKWFIFEAMRIVVGHLLDPLLALFWVVIAC